MNKNRDDQTDMKKQKKFYPSRLEQAVIVLPPAWLRLHWLLCLICLYAGSPPHTRRLTPASITCSLFPIKPRE